LSLAQRFEQMIPRGFLIRIAPWWLALLIIGSLLPGPEKDVIVGSTPPAAIAQRHPAPVHRVVHYLSFGSTALILMLISETAAQQFAVACSVALLGLTLEWLQFSVFSLMFLEWWDVRDDALACFVVLVLIQWPGLRDRLCDSSGAV
jgi:hypothetical protein